MCLRSVFLSIKTMDLASLQAKTSSLTFDFEGEAITAQILPHKLTPEYRSQLQKLSKEQTSEDAKDADALMISDLVADWDVVNNGASFPPTYENLRLVPLSLLAATATEILEFVGKLAAPKPRNK